MKRKEKQSNISEKSVLRRNIAFRVRTLSKRDYLFGNKLCFELNEPASFVWDNINGVDSIEEIINEVAKEYDIEYAEAKEDILFFINDMIEHNVFVLCDQNG